MFRWTKRSFLLPALCLLTLTPAFSTRQAPAADRKAAAFEVYQDRGGEFRWRLRTTNGQIIATSGEGYKEKRSCLQAIESVKKDAASAPVEEEAAAK